VIDDMHLRPLWADDNPAREFIGEKEFNLREDIQCLKERAAELECAAALYIRGGASLLELGEALSRSRKSFS